MKTPKMQEPKSKNAHQRFVDQISWHGAYHTFGPNAKNLETSIKRDDNEKVQNIENQMQKNEERIWDEK